MILMDVSMADERIAMLRETGIDAVLIGVPADTAGLACVDLDFAAAGQLCVEHLAGLGHREVAFIGEAPAVYQRRSGFAERTMHGAAEYAAARGIRLVHRPCEASHEAAAGAITRILQDRPGTTGLVVQNEAIISPLLSVLRAAGRTVPEDMSVVAICPDEVAERTAPDLGGHPGRGHGPPGGRDADPPAGRRRGQRGGAAAAGTHRPGQHRAGPGQLNQPAGRSADGGDQRPDHLDRMPAGGGLAWLGGRIVVAPLAADLLHH